MNFLGKDYFEDIEFNNKVKINDKFFKDLETEECNFNVKSN